MDKSERSYPHTYSVRMIKDLRDGDHLCCLYEAEEEHRAVLTPFIRQGLECGEKVLYIVNAYTAETILGYLRDDGVDVNPFLARGQLTILSSDDAYMREGIFDPERMITLLRAETDEAVAEGYSALRVTGEMTWALRGLPGSEKLIEYEAKLNEFFPGSKCLAVCQYDRRRFDCAVLLEVLRTHPIAVIGTTVYDNFYYIPPTELLGRDLSAAELQHCILNLAKRKQVEEALRASEEKFRKFFENEPEYCYMVSPEGVILDVNKAALKALGYEKKEIVGKPLKMIYSPESLPKMKQLFAIWKKTGHLRDEEMVILTKERDKRTVLLSADTVKDEYGKIQQSISIQRDITSRKQAEEQLKRTMAKLARSNAELEQFAAVASHDLKEPLRMVASYVQLLAKRYKGKLDSDADEFIAYAVDGVRRMERQINDLLAYSRVDSKGKDFALTDCEAIFERTLTHLKKAIEESSAVVSHDALPTLMAEKSQLGQLFQNLIGNAIKFHGKEPPHIHVSAERIEKSAIRNAKSQIRIPKSEIKKGWVFSLRDNGIGIDPEQAERIFLIFQRLHGRDEYPGTGIGLAICTKIVERHGGHIWVDSEPGKGSTFYFTIPTEGGVNNYE